MAKKLLIIFALLVNFSLAFSQTSPDNIGDYQRAYLNARDLYNLGKYNLAMEAFKPLTAPDENNPFSEYASFFYALSAFNNNNKQLSKEMFLQITKKFPDWEKLDDIYLWLAKINFENQDYFQAMHYLSLLKGRDVKKTGKNMKDHYFKLETDIAILENLLTEFKDEKVLAQTLAYRISCQPLSEIDFDRLTELIDEYKLDPSKYNLFEGNKVVKKDAYNIAVLLPFMFDDLQPQRGRWSNQFILDIYEGITYSIKELNKMDMHVNLFAFDTKRDSLTTADLVSSGQLNSMDAIVGPLYTGPSKVIADFSFGHKIDMINPLSNNSEVTGNNPYSFLYQPTSQSYAAAAAGFVHGKFENKNAAIFYGDSQQDFVLAKEYQKLIKEDSFNVVIFKKIRKNETKEIFEILMNTYEVDDTLDIDPESDKLDVLVIEPDSIGHVFIASNDGLFGSTMISTLESRGDTIQLIANEEMLNLRSLDFEVVEKLGVWFLAPNYFQRPNEHYLEFREDYLQKNYELPTQNILLGYNLGLFLGMNMYKYGKYFQVGVHQPDFQPGYLRTGFKLGPWNDNQWIPIVRLRNEEVIWLNKEELLTPSEQ